MAIELIRNNQINPAQELEDEQKYAGPIAAQGLPSFLIEKLFESVSAVNDSIRVSTEVSNSVSNTSNADKAKQAKGKEKSDGSNYIENHGDDDGGGSMTTEELLSWIEDQLYDFVMDLLASEDDLMTDEDGDGYYEIDEKVLEKYYKKVASFCAARLMIALVWDTRNSAQQLIFEAYNPPDPEDANSAKDNEENKPLSFMESVAKSNEMTQSIMTEFMTTLIQRCMTENMETYNARCEDYKEEASEWHDKYIPFCSDTEWYLDKLKAETEDFENAMKNTMEDIRQVMSAINSTFGPMNSLLPGLGASLDNIEDKIDAIIPEIPDYDEVSGGIPEWVDILGFLGPDALLYAGIRLILGACGVGDPSYDGAYIDVNALRNAFSDVRDDLVGTMSILSVRLQCMSTLEDVKASIYEAFNNRQFVKNNTLVLAQVMDSEAQHQLALFDRLTETTLATAKLRNQVVYINKQIQKAQKPTTRLLTTAASTLQIVAVVLAVLGCIFSWTGVGAVIAMVGVALMAAITAYLAQAYSNDVIQDDYVPDANESEENEAEQKAENKREKLLQQLQQSQNNILNDLNSSMVTTGSDGYQSVEYGLIADKYRQFISQQNLMRIIFEIQEIQQSLNQAIRATFTGLSGPKRNSILANSLELHLGQGRANFDRLVANVKECADAYNMEYQQEEQVYNAGITLAWSCGLAVAGGCLGGVGGGIGIQIGVALGQAIGNIIGQLGSNYGWWGKGGSYGAEFDPQAGNIKDVGKHASSLAESISNAETNVYAEALEHGDCDAGDGYEAVDNDKMAQLQSRLLGLANVKAIIAAISQLTQQLKAMIIASYGNITPEETDILTPSVKADFESSIKIFSYIKQAVEEHVTVQNRARDAQIEVGKSWAKFGLNVLTAIVGAFVGLGSTSTAFTNLIPALISIENTLVDLISGIIHSRPEYGDLSDQVHSFDEGEENGDHNEGHRLNDRGAEMDTMSQIDEQANSLGFDDGMFETVGGGHISINSGELALANSKLRSMMRIAELIKEARKTQAKVMADIIEVHTGIMEPESNLFDNMTNNYKAMMTEMLQSKFAIMQAYATRNNQIADQERSMWQSVASLVMEAAITALTQSIAGNKEDAGDIMERGQTVGNTPDETNQLADLQSNIQNMTIANIALQALRPWVESLAGVIYDDAAHSEDTSRTEQHISSRQSGLIADEDAEGLAVLDAMEAEELSASFEAGQIDLNMDALEVDARLNEEIGQGVMSAAKSYSNLVKDAVDLAADDNPINQMIQFNRMRDELMDLQIDTQDAIFNPETFAQYQDALTQLQDAVTEFNKDPNQTNTANLQLAYANFISTLSNILPELNNIMASLQQVQERAETLEDQRTQLLGDEATEPTPEEVEADQGLVSNTELAARIDTLKQKIDRMQAILAQISDPNTNPEEIPALLEELETISAEVQNVQSSIQSGLENSEVMVDASAACVSQNIAESLLAQLDAKIKAKYGDKRIEDLSADELRGLYQDLRESQFTQSVILRNAARTLQNALQKILNGTQLTAAEQARALEALATLEGSTELSQQDKELLTYARTALAAEGEISDETRMCVGTLVGHLGSIQGECQQKIQNFNRLIGQIRGILKDKYEMSDAQIDEFLAVGLDTPMPESPLAPSGTTSAPAEPVAAVTTAPAQPQMDSNTQALLALAESISTSTPIIDEQNGTIQINGQVYTIEDLVSRLQGLDQNQLSDQQKLDVDKALALLQQVQAPQVEIDPVVSATVTSSAAPAAAPVVAEAEDDTETEEEEDAQLEVIFQGCADILEACAGAFDAAARATSGSQLAILDQMSEETSAEVRAS